MAKIKVTRADGEEQIFPITPIIEVSYEKWAKQGFGEIKKATDIYWLAWECIRRSGEVVKPFDSDGFLETLKQVDVLVDDPNG